MMWNVTLCRQLIFEDAIEAESEEEAVEIARAISKVCGGRI